MDRRPRTKVQRDAIQQIKRAFDALPPYHDDELTVTQAIRMLVPDIQAMRTKGYALAAVAGFLAEHGLAITVPSLKAVLSPPRGEADGKKKGRRKGKRDAGRDAARGVRGEVQEATPARATPDTAAATALPKVGAAEVPASRSKTDTVVSRSEARVAPAAPVSERRWNFVPRKDSDEI
jgi:hypothetical protein